MLGRSALEALPSERPGSGRIFKAKPPIAHVARSFNPARRVS
jgi:hypothetical protein